jgi:uncharacterized delta-60 repeat protein
MSNIARLMRMALVGGSSDYWIGVLGGTGDDQFTGVAVDSENNIITSGYTNSAGAGGYDGLIVKYDPLGELLWSRVLGGTANDFFRNIAIDSTDNIIVAGSAIIPSERGLLAKYDPSGTLLWDRGFSAFNNPAFSGVAVDSNNAIVTVGNVASISMAVGKFTTATGAITFYRTFNGVSVESFSGVAINSANEINAVGFSFSNSAGSSDCVIGKYNSSGTQLWLRRLGGSGFDQFFRVAINSVNDIIAVGVSASVVSGQNVGLLVKYNTSGTLLWARRLGTTDSLSAVVVDSNGDIVVVGSTSGNGLVAKYNTSGTLLWARALVGAVGLTAVAVDSDDNIIATGRTSVAGAGGNDCLVVKLPTDGSGAGTYGAFVYQAAVITSVSVSLTDAVLSAPEESYTVTGAAAGLTDSPVALTEQFFPVNA